MACWVEFSERLDVMAVLPFLCSQHLLTNYDIEKLTHPNAINREKVDHLLTVLPRKDRGWFERFLDCLVKSAEGTSHADLAAQLQMKFEEELRKPEHNTQKVLGSCNHQVSTHGSQVNQSKSTKSCYVL